MSDEGEGGYLYPVCSTDGGVTESVEVAALNFRQPRCMLGEDRDLRCRKKGGGGDNEETRSMWAAEPEGTDGSLGDDGAKYSGREGGHLQIGDLSRSELFAARNAKMEVACRKPTQKARGNR